MNQQSVHLLCHPEISPVFSEIEDQFASELSQFEMNPKYIDWAYEALDEVEQKDQTVNKGSFEALQAALEGVDRRIDNL